MKRAIVIVLFLLVALQSFAPFGALADEFDYSIYDALLRKYVADGKVDYLEWKESDFEVFEKYIRGLDSVSLENMERDEQKVFWINTYNALTIYGVLKRIPDRNLLARFFSVMMVPGFFDTITYDVAGGSLTLNDIEHKKLRAIFKDPRIHFTIVCASRSCPEIQTTAFEAKGLDARLDRSTRSFIQDKTRNRLDRERSVLRLSEIFNWFAEDFISEADSVINFLKIYLSEEDVQYLSSHEVQIKYLFYDWLVNIKR